MEALAPLGAWVYKAGGGPFVVWGCALLAVIMKVVRNMSKLGGLCSQVLLMGSKKNRDVTFGIVLSPSHCELTLSFLLQLM